MARLEDSKPRVPLHVRLAARAAIFSLLLALAALVLANVLPPSMVTAGLRLVFLATSSIGVLALVLWVVFSGIRAAFGRREAPTIEPSGGDLW